MKQSLLNILVIVIAGFCFCVKAEQEKPDLMLSSKGTVIDNHGIDSGLNKQEFLDFRNRYLEKFKYERIKYLKSKGRKYDLKDKSFQNRLNQLGESFFEMKINLNKLDELRELGAMPFEYSLSYKKLSLLSDVVIYGSIADINNSLNPNNPRAFHSSLRIKPIEVLKGEYLDISKKSLINILYFEGEVKNHKDNKIYFQGDKYFSKSKNLNEEYIFYLRYNKVNEGNYHLFNKEFIKNLDTFFTVVHHEIFHKVKANEVYSSSSVNAKPVSSLVELKQQVINTEIVNNSGAFYTTIKDGE